MKQLLTVILFSLLSLCGRGQSEQVDYSTTVKQQAEVMGLFLIKKDLNSFSRYTHPKVLEMMGGKEKMIEQLEKGIKEMESEGIYFLEITIKEPSKIINVSGELQCTLVERIVLKVPKGKLITESSLIAVSMDKGKNWYFLDTSKRGLQEMQEILPNLSSELIILPKKPPVFYDDKNVE